MIFKYFFVYFSFLTSTATVYCQTAVSQSRNQKPEIDTSVIGKWPHATNPELSDDGRFVSFYIENEPVGEMTLVLKSTETGKEKRIIGVTDGTFVGNRNDFLFKQSDTLKIISLEDNIETKISHVKSYKVPYINNGAWVAYSLSNGNLVLRSLLSNVCRNFENVVDYSFSNKGQVLIVSSKDTAGKNNLLTWVDIKDSDSIIHSKVIFYESSIVSGFNIDETESRLVFQAYQNNNEQSRSIYYYDKGMGKATKQFDDSHNFFGSKIRIASSVPKFNFNSNFILFTVTKIEDRVEPIGVPVDIWNYKDSVIQSAQVSDLKKGESINYTVAFNIINKEIVQLEQNDERISKFSPDGDHLIIQTHVSAQYSWSEGYARKAYYLLSIHDGSRKKIKSFDNSVPLFSPHGSYVVWYDRKQRNYYSYKVATGETRNITGRIGQNLFVESEVYDQPEVGIVGWLSNEASVIIYDNYDLWKVDLTSNQVPVNITNGFGKRNSIKLRSIKESTFSNDATFSLAEPIILVAFNTVNKQNGFYMLNLTVKNDPKLLYMGPCVFYRSGSQKQHFYSFNEEFKPLKAKSSEAWVVLQQSSTEYPNYCFTKDFKSFLPLSDLQPQKNYNWLTAQLITWKQFDGTVGQGILYKPENFNAANKYPVIINYYEYLSHRLNEFPLPEFFRDNINIPLLIGQGYLVFTPDIRLTLANTTGKTNGDNAFNSVVSAAMYLSKISWINAKKIAIQGHSFGGGITNYLITKTEKFAAACEGAGGSDIISSYLRLTGPLDAPDNTVMNFAEFGQGRIGVSFWEKKDLYLKSSAIIDADKVSTPLLIMHNKADGAVPWMQGVEMYLALTRLKKKVWMLQYDKGRHSVSGRNSIDYTTRMMQFFNHYLKSAPAPLWMTQGIPAKLKGVITGYEYDPANNCGKDCKVCKQWNEKFEKDSAATWKEIEKRKLEEHWQ